jgi:hypothetical protein
LFPVLPRFVFLSPPFVFDLDNPGKYNPSSHRGARTRCKSAPFPAFSNLQCHVLPTSFMPGYLLLLERNTGPLYLNPRHIPRLCPIIEHRLYQKPVSFAIPGQKVEILCFFKEIFHQARMDQAGYKLWTCQ